MISLFDFVTLTKKGGIIDDSANKPMEFGAVLGFCTFKDNTTGVLLNSKDYTIRIAYIGEDKLIHCGIWNASSVKVAKEKMHLAKGIKEFNLKTLAKSKKIIKVMLLDGTNIKEGLYE